MPISTLTPVTGVNIMHQTLGGGLTLVGAAILMDAQKRFLFA
jgi:hypothetical protein